MGARVRALATAAWILSGALLAACAAPPRVFVANAGDHTVSVIDHELEREIAVIAVGEFPQGVAVRPAPPLVAVVSSRDRSVQFLDPARLELLGEPVRVGYFPMHAAFTPDGRTLVVANHDARSLSLVDVETRRLVGGEIPVEGRPQRLALSPDGRFAYAVLQDEDGRLAVVDLPARRLVRRIPVGRFPTDLALSPDGTEAFVASFDDATVTRLAVPSGEVLARYRMDTGLGLLFDPRRRRLYSIATMEGEVVVFDTEREREVARIPVGEDPIYSALTPDGRWLYVVNGSDGNVMKIDAESLAVRLRIAVGREPTDAAVLP